MARNKRSMYKRKMLQENITVNATPYAVNLKDASGTDPDDRSAWRVTRVELLSDQPLAEIDLDNIFYLQRTPSGVTPAAGDWYDEKSARHCKTLGKHSVSISSTPTINVGFLTRLIMRGKLKFRVEEDEDLYFVTESYTDTPTALSIKLRVWYYLPMRG